MTVPSIHIQLDATDRDLMREIEELRMEQDSIAMEIAEKEQALRIHIAMHGYTIGGER